MKLTVKLFATFRQGRFAEAELELAEGTTLGSLADGLRIPREEIGILMVGGRHAELAHRPAPGDVVAIFPLLGGG
ncbi:MAG: MoaD/ThiS family protein [Deltaproteobacteria bacterium]|nr:MoaD/ThiS family protein [Deltaproteobacteria bacterium]